MRAKKLFEVSPIRTLRFNLHYFGLKGLKLPVLISRNTKLHTLRGGVSLDTFRPGSVRIGFSGVGTCDVKCERAMWEVYGKVRFGSDVALGQGTRVSVADGGELSFGDGFTVTARTSIICKTRIEFGKDVLLSWDNLIMDTDFHQIDDSIVSAPVCIGDHVWLGCRCLVLKGSTIPRGSVLAAGTTVTKQLPEEESLYGGINKLIRKGVSWRK